MAKVVVLPLRNFPKQILDTLALVPNLKIFMPPPRSTAPTTQLLFTKDFSGAENLTQKKLIR